jgi:hypothetical protein
MSYSIFIDRPDYLSVAEYLEYLLPTTSEDTGTYADGYIEFNYGDTVDERGVEYPITGLKTRQRKVVIETTADLPFKVDDKVRFNQNPGQVYKIETITYENTEAKRRVGYLFNGAREFNKKKIITLV